MTNPLVSILISVYNAGKYLRPSVQSILSQTYSNLEILIINDGSTDHCMDSITDIEDKRLRIITQQNTGKAAALNRALNELSGMFYAIHDADDISHPYRIDRQVQCMLDNPDIAAVFTGHDLIIDGQHMAPQFPVKNIQQCRYDIEQFRMPAHDPTAMYRVSMVHDLQYEPTLKVAEGLDYILCVGEQFPMMVLGDCLYSYRIHFDSITRQNLNGKKPMIRKALLRALERRGLKPTELFPPPITSTAKPHYRELEDGIIPHFMESVLHLRRTGQNRLALKTAWACLRLHPSDLYYYKPLVYSLMPLPLVTHYRSIRRKLDPCEKLPKISLSNQIK